MSDLPAGPDWNIQTYEQLTARLRDWTSFGDGPGTQYDYNGMLHLLGACVDNLRENVDEHVLQTFGPCLEEDQLSFLEQLVRLAREGREEWEKDIEEESSG